MARIASPTDKQRFLKEAVKNRPFDQSREAALHVAKIQWDMNKKYDKLVARRESINSIIPAYV